MKRALLVNLPKTDLMVPPAALGVLAGVCAENSVAYDFEDFTVTLSKQFTDDEWLEMDNWLTGVSDSCSPQVLARIDAAWQHSVLQRAAQYDYVCISVLSYWSIHIAMHLLAQNDPDRTYKIIIGGGGCQNYVDGRAGSTSLGTWLLQHSYVDHVVYGDGEAQFAQILQGIPQTPTPHNADLDLYPTPRYQGIRFDDYKARAVFVTGSRGCVRKCTFCDIDTIWPQFRYRKAELVVEEIIQHYYELGVERFEFTDSLINGSVSNFYRFNTLLAEAKAKNSDLKNITYVGQFIARPRHQMLPSHYEAMYHAGCAQVTIGMESFSERVRDEMRKRFSNQDIDYHIKQCARWGISNIWLMIVGYPTETLADHEDNLRAIERYAPYARTGVLEMIRWGATLHYIDGTPLTQEHLLSRYGIYEPGAHSTTRPGSSYTWKTHGNPELTLKERIRRRLELHAKTVEHRIPQARPLEDLLILDKMADEA